MASTFQYETKINVAGRTITKSNSYSATGSASINGESVTNGTTDFQINLSIDTSEVEAIYINSSQAVTIETNAGDTNADDSLSLAADKPLIWVNDGRYSFPLSADVTALFVTNASGSTATIDVEVIQDSTP